MRILGIDINRNGIKIPFTGVRIPIPLLVGALIHVFGTPSAAYPVCPKPTGDYESSCSPNDIGPYISSDPNVPEGCVLKTECNTMFSGLPRVPNEIYYARHDSITNVSNNNGTLSYTRNANIPPAAQTNNGNANIAPVAQQAPCANVPLRGSFQRTCHVESTSAYASSDPNLQSTSLCQADISCEKVGGSHQNGLTVWYDRSRGGATIPETVENCNGKLKVGWNDNECNGKEWSRISRIADDYGQTKLKV